MIVKDEEATIARCIGSVSGFVDKVIVIDTGSTDKTKQVLTETCETFGLEVHVEDRPWVNFGHNRTELLEIAYGQADWLLLLDADMELVWHSKEIPEGFDSFLLWYSGSMSYAQKLLVSGRRKWRYVGATHEYIECLEPNERQATSLGGIRVTHHMDGGSRHNKIERDLELLEKERQEDEENPRTVFYLAQTLEDAGNLLGACVNYGIRANMGGWEEERWLAQLRQAKLWPDANGTDKESLDMLLGAWEARPWRSEPLYHYSALSRKLGRHNLALMAARQGRSIALPDQDILFVERWVYDWGFVFEESISLWYCGQRSESLELNQWLLEQELPFNFREAVLRNMAYGHQDMQHMQVKQTQY
jgi:glycosyltransferase involved in cell wall biosynthesis